jgi:hypothetical protein
LKNKNQQPKDTYAHSLKNEDFKQNIVTILSKIKKTEDQKLKKINT